MSSGLHLLLMFALHLQRSCCLCNCWLHLSNVSSTGCPKACMLRVRCFPAMHVQTKLQWSGRRLLVLVVAKMVNAAMLLVRRL